MDTHSYDIIVVGGGPAGCVAAKKCARGGLNTLLLEQHRLPRDKVCTGMIMGPWAKDTIAQEFGDIPQGILSDPFYLKGIMLHVAGAKSKVVSNRMPIGWRKDIDYWLCQKAREAGAKVVDGARVTAITAHEAGYELMVQPNRGGDKEKYICRFVIGANGADRAVVKSIFPAFQAKIRPAFRECYDAHLTLDKRYFHWFFPSGTASPRFNVVHKGSFWLLEGGGLKELAGEIGEVLAEYGFSAEVDPVWRDGCAMLSADTDFFDQGSGPAKGNVLLAGDAGFFTIPFTVEGVGPALKSGSLAADAVLEAVKLGKTADAIYAGKIKKTVQILQSLRSREKKMKDMAAQGAEALGAAMAEYIEESFYICNE